MADQTTNAWRCGVCGYIHRGPEPPDWCPVCGAPREKFEPYTDAAPTAAPAAQGFRCLNCGHVHTGAEPPAPCPVCGAPPDRFEGLAGAAEAAAVGQAVKAVIVGAGIAGVSAAEAIRQSAPDAEIALVSGEDELPYYRLNLTRYVAGEIDRDDLPLHPASWYEEQNVRLLRGETVSALDLESGVADLRSGGPEPFEKLVLTAGAHPFVPPIAGAQREGVMAFRTLQDADQMLQAAQPGAKCVCIGGGILGLETAAGLTRRGAEVTLLEGFGWLLPRQLNRRAGEILQQHVATLGIDVRTAAAVGEILGDGRVSGVQLEDATVVPADLVVISTGVRPNSDLARAAGLAVNNGVTVDDHLVTSHPDVLAAGDVAEHGGVAYGLWFPSQYQGSIAGLNAIGVETEFGGIPRSNTLKVVGCELFSIGEVEPPDASFAVVEQESDGQYMRFVFRDSRLAGGILLGDTSLSAPLSSAIEKGTDCSALLQERPAAADVASCLGEGGE